MNKLNFLKLVLISLLFVVTNSLSLVWQRYYLLFNIFIILLIVYFGETAKTVLDIFKKRLKRPVLTKKTVPLILTGILLEITFLLFVFNNFKEPFQFAMPLLMFDVLTPLVVSVIVLLFQPFAVLMRNRILRKAKSKRERFRDLLVIGITGSYGKTSTKELLYTILAEKFGNKVLKTKEHQNSEVGISQCILDDLNENHQIFIVEMGAYNRGGIKLLCDIVKPKIGILTGINEQHMATFGSLENIIKTKYELIESLPEDGIAFFNAKNKYCVELFEKTRIKKFLYGQNAELAGLENIEGAKTVAKEVGMAEEEINRALDKIENKFGGITIKEGVNGLKIVDATYSANPDSVISHLEYFKTFPGKKIIVMPCLIELGKASREIHQKIGKKIAAVCDLAIITTKDRFKEIKEGAGDKAIFMEDPKEIFEKIKSFSKEGDIVLLESRVPGKLIDFLTNK